MSTDSNLLLKQIELGPLQNFLYFLGDKEKKEIAVVDPAWDVDFLRDQAEDNDWKITNIFLTHGHPDHVNGLDDLLSTHDIPVYISKFEADFYTPQCKNLHKVDNHEQLHVGDVTFECIHMPGHTPGCQSFLADGHMITGDAVFIDGCGRCDLPGGDPKVMYHTLYKILMKFPESTVLYPGHNYGPVPFATLGEQKKTNPYLDCANEKDFLTQRMGLIG